MSQTSLQARVQSLAESLRASEEKCAELESCGMRYKAVEDEVKRLRKELEEAREVSSASAASLHKLAAEMSSQAETLAQAQSERDLARRDRDAIERQMKHLEMECERKDRDLEAAEAKLSVVKARKRELAAANERDSATTVAEAQRRVDAEIARLTEKQEGEVSQIS
ncbi:gliding-associated protein 45, putative, partial [Perkinsus marinus ATCC 50983]